MWFFKRSGRPLSSVHVQQRGPEEPVFRQGVTHSIRRECQLGRRMIVKKTSKLRSKVAKANIMSAKLMSMLAIAMQDGGWNPDQRLKSLSKNRATVEVMVNAMINTLIVPVNGLEMEQEPEGHSFVFGKNLEEDGLWKMIRTNFKLEHHLQLSLPAYYHGGFPMQHCHRPPKETPTHREFRILEIQAPIRLPELYSVLLAQGWHHAWMYDLVRVRNYQSEHPLFAMGSALCNEGPSLQQMELRQSYISTSGIHQPKKYHRFLVWR